MNKALNLVGPKASLRPKAGLRASLRPKAGLKVPRKEVWDQMGFKKC